MIITRRRAVQVLLVGTAVAGLVPAGFAQGYDIKFTGFTGGQLKGLPIGIAAYQLTVYTQHQATAVANIEARSRLTTTLVGLDEALLRRLADAGHADLKAQLAAAGIALAPADETRGALAAAGAAFAPGNIDIKDIRGGITIGKSVKKAYAAVGAAEAPMIAGVADPTATGVGGILARFGSGNKIGNAAKAMKTILIAPALVIDFAKSDAGSRGNVALATSDLRFTLARSSIVNLQSPSKDGRFNTPGMMTLTRDHEAPTAFATVATGDGAVRAMGSGNSWTDRNFQTHSAIRGDAAVLDVAVWEGLVRDAYRAFNGAIVAAIVKARG